MKLLLKVATVLIISVLLISSVYIVFFTGPEDSKNNDINGDDEPNDDTGDNTSNDDTNNGGENNDQEIKHIVFIEEGTATWCNNCPDVAKALHEHFSESDEHHFYYVVMVDDCEKASKHLHENYNIYGFPTIFIDGGYGVVMGATDFKSRFMNKCCQEVSAAVFRDVPALYLNVDAKWNTNKSELTVTATIENKESDTYTGLLKVYITEINSRWSDWNGYPYHFAFLDYAISKNVKIKPDGNKSFSETWKATYTNVYPENLWIVAVVFNSESVQAYSDPPNNEHSFDAYYADAADAVRVAEGSLPPSVGICWPKSGRYCLLGFCNEKLKTLSKKTVLVGRTTIKVCLEGDLNIEKVEFTVQGRIRKIQATVDEAPWEWTWHKFAFGRYTISVKVYDEEGRTATDSMEVIAFILPEKIV